MMRGRPLHDHSDSPAGSENAPGGPTLPDPPGTIDRALRRLALATGAAAALLLRPRADHRRLATLAAAGTADRFESRRLARIVTPALLDLPRAPGIPTACLLHDTPVLLHWLASGEDLAITLVRHPGAPPFTETDQATLAAMLGWVEDIVDLWWQHQRGEARAAGLRAALGRSDIGTILLDRSARIVDANAAAERLLRNDNSRNDNGRNGNSRNGNGSAITRRGRGVEATDPDDAAALRRAIHAVILDHPASRTPRNLTLRRTDHRRPLIATVLQPLRQATTGLAADDPVVLLLLVDSETGAPSVADACGLYGLTASETRLARALCSGMTVAEAATSLNLQPSSARTYLRRIFAKTGVVRQSGLIQLLTNSRIPAATRRSPRPPAPPPLRPMNEGNPA